MKGTGWKRYARVIALGALLALSLAAPCGTPVLGTAPIEYKGVAQQVVSPLASITLTPTGDTTLQEAHPTINYDNSEFILGRIDGGRSRALLEFNVGKIPLGATVNSATLRIYQHGWYDYGGSVRTISADRVTAAWHEAVATWNYAPTIGETVGSVSVGMSTGWYEINVTTLVQEWYAGTSPNYGLLLRGYESSENLYRLFTPRLYVNEPELVVNYTLQPTTLDVSTGAISFLADGQKTHPSPSILRIGNSGTGVMNWSIDTGSTPWLDVSPASGSTSASYRTPVEVSVLTDTLSAGTYTAPFTITASGAQESPQVVQVTVNYSGDPLSEIFVPLVMQDATGTSSPGTGSQTVALFIGVADYQHLGPAPSSSARTGDWGYDLVYIDQNPHHVRKPLSAFGEVNSDNARVLRDAEAPLANIEQAFAWADEREEKSSGAQTKVVITYGGHGGRDGGGAYLITAHDTNEAGGYFTDAMPAATLDGWMDNFESGQILFVIDACHSGGLLSGLEQTGRVILTATDSDNSAWETSEWNGGVFTHYFVQALMDPIADTNGDGCVSAEEAYTYAASRTDDYVQTHMGSVQQPQMYDGVSGDFLLTRPPSYGPMTAAQAIVLDESVPLGSVYFASEPVRLPTVVTPMQ